MNKNDIYLRNHIWFLKYTINTISGMTMCFDTVDLCDIRENKGVVRDVCY